jgi:hypothetical protein
MSEKSLRFIKYGTVIFLTLFSFLISYFSFDRVENTNLRGDSSTKSDKLSGTSYFAGDIYNYREANPYGSYFIGFDSLSERGVSKDDMRYIKDVIINFLMYDKKIYNAKVSFMKDSFGREYSQGTATTYSFKFGINDQDIHKIRVISDSTKEKIEIMIYNTVNKTVFSKSFKLLSY